MIRMKISMMNRTIRNARHYRKQDIKIGDMVTPEKYYCIREQKDINGNMISINGIIETFGTVVKIYNHHCSVLVSELRYKNGEFIFPIKEENRFITAINFFRGEANVKEEDFDL